MKESIAATPDARLYHEGRNLESDRRLEALKEVCEDYLPYDFVVGVTVFGSTAHGRAHEKSDIDTCMFIDPDELADSDDPIELDDSDYREIALIIEQSLAQKLGVQPEALSSSERCDVRVYPINERIVQQIVGNFERQTEVYSDYENKRSELLARRIGSDNYSWEKFNEESQAMIGDEPKIPIMDVSVSKLFHPAVGDPSRLNELRSQIISVINASQYKEEIWQDVVLVIETFEGSLHDNGIQFPKNFEEARFAFGRVPTDLTASTQELL